MGRRVPAFDLARGFAVVVMVCVHALILYGSPALNGSVPALLLIALGIPTGSAPAFILVMGASLGLSRAGRREGVRRGLRLLLLGYGLNLLRAVPFAIAFRPGAVPPGDVPLYVPTSFGATLFLVDILQFAGLAVILVSLLGPHLRHPRQWVALAAVVAVGSPWLWGRHGGWAPLDRALDLLWGTDPHVIFPLFPWSAYVFLGRGLGAWLAAGVEEAVLFRRGAQAGIGLVVAGGALALSAPGFYVGSFSRGGPGAVLAIAGAALIWLAACHWVIRRYPSAGVLERLRFWGRRVGVMYVTHWVLLAWGLLLVGYRRQGWLGTGLVAVAALVLAHQVARARSAGRRSRLGRPVEQPG